MKTALTIFFFLPLFLFSQEDNSYNLANGDFESQTFSFNDNTDSIVKKEKLFLNPGWKKHNHIVDFIWTQGVFRFDSHDGALGYRYLYRANWKYAVKFGARIGFWGRTSRDDIPSVQHRNYFNYSFSGIINFPLWTSFNLEVAPGVLSELFWPKETNILDSQGLHSGTTFFYQRVGINAIFLSHICIDFGVHVLRDSVTKNWYWKSYIGIGYKF